MPGRPKLEKLPKAKPLTTPVSFTDVESAIQEQDRDKTAALLATFYGQAGGAELARRLLLLGSGYLQDSLGHSVSCTAFILLAGVARYQAGSFSQSCYRFNTVIGVAVVMTAFGEGGVRRFGLLGDR